MQVDPLAAAELSSTSDDSGLDKGQGLLAALHRVVDCNNLVMYVCDGVILDGLDFRSNHPLSYSQFRRCIVVLACGSN